MVLYYDTYLIGIFDKIVKQNLSLHYRRLGPTHIRSGSIRIIYITCRERKNYDSLNVMS
jgi:hypothetical protein